MTQSSGILAGANPIAFDATNPLPLFIIQMLIILITCRLIKFILTPLKQPSVIAEIIGGIILGPTAMGRIPGYMNAIFPKESLPFLNLVSNFGLVLFLFLVGLELDPRMIKKSIRKSILISLAGMALPFGVGAAVSYGLFHLIEPSDNTTAFSTYLLFLGVAMSITAFPVLARILTELDLLKTPVGSITISAAAVDDATSWCLLALVISLINAGSGINALYVFLMGIGYTLILIFLIRPVFIIIIRRCGAFEGSISHFVVFLTLSLVFFSAFITDMIGIHAIFGGFITGVIMPHQGGFARHITEKIEDMVIVLLLPLYFTLSGLKTQIGVLDDGVAWGMVFLVIFTACVGKITGCTIAARFSNLQWRESFAVGILMNCKGLVELIVLNIGLDSKVISQKTFVIMVIMALVTTFLTVPLITFVYPKSYYNQISGSSEEGKNPAAELTSDTTYYNKVLVCLNKLEHVPALMTMVKLLQSTPEPVKMVDNVSSPAQGTSKLPVLNVTALRLIELSDRNSSIMLHSDSEMTMRNDPAINVFKTFGHLTAIGVRSILRVVNPSQFAETISSVSRDQQSDLILLPWGGSGTIIDNSSDTPLEKLFNSETKENNYTSIQHSSFIRDVFRTALSRVGVLIDRGLNSTQTVTAANSVSSLEQLSSVSHRIFLPFFGGKDDRAALDLMMLISYQTAAQIIIVRYKSKTNDIKNENEAQLLSQETFIAGASGQEDILLSEKEDERILNSYFGSNQTNPIRPNITYSEVNSSMPLASVVESIQDFTGKDLILVGRNKVATINSLYGSEVKRIDNHRRKVLGDIAESIILSNSHASVLVVQERK
ncbi:hypothetical protein K502DRAFT_304504 [Neoconidiobolus thromboides FSU 785]|nr:hypothetical protein K502DRAFT_304504 [Neoconidiobolus thromboides FSU 785]